MNQPDEPPVQLPSIVTQDQQPKLYGQSDRLNRFGESNLAVVHFRDGSTIELTSRSYAALGYRAGRSPSQNRIASVNETCPTPFSRLQRCAILT